MRVDQVLHRMGGVASRRALLRVVERREVDAALRRGEVVRDARGRYALPIADSARRAANRVSGVVSHRSAALLHGWEVKTVPDLPDVMVRAKRHLTREQRDGIEPHWSDLTPDEVHQGVTTVERTLVDCLRGLPFDEALAIALDVEGLHLEPQVVIRDRAGRGRADLVDRGRRLVVECESHSWHSKRGALRPDCRRYTKLVLLDWRVLRFAWEDVMFHPDYVRECLEAAAALIAGEQENSAAHRAAAA